ncbi:hypothetical protein [Bacillus sp. AFS017274]|uniref:hypothetical protein n=1 Tax=Bacillaceae TaxID=186817 RepID=UPI000BF5A2F4|nr:hypothetical protein [Bacillus sp. AFS017274]PEZ74739.1 hypothetical protein CN380_23555 [Bacillus sp. AFS017274]
MFIKKFTVGLLLLGSLAACDNEQVTNPEKVNNQEGISKAEPTRTNNLPEAAKYHPIYGGWITDKSYIMISLSDTEGNILENIVKKNEKKDRKYFKLAESTDNKITAIMTSKEGSNRNSFFTLELNKEENELTITMPNENPVTYIKATMDPEEFNPEFVW